MNNTFVIEANRGVANLAFGSSRNAVHAWFGEPKGEFYKTELSKNTTDNYGLFHVFYRGDDNTFLAIEFSKKAVLIVNGVQLPTNYAELCAWIKASDPDASVKEDGIISVKLSMGVYAPYGAVESILFGEKDYYA